MLQHLRSFLQDRTAMRRIRALAREAAAITLVTVALTESIGLFVKPTTYFWDFRNLFISKTSFRPIGHDGLWTYQPNSTVMSAAVFHLTGFHGWIEYRCTFATDRFGFVRTNFDPTTKRVDYLILGDSYTEGQGGCPWLTKANLDQGSDPTVLNAASQGAGIVQSEMTAEWIANEVEIGNVVLIAISNDFKRVPQREIWRGREECLTDGRCDPLLDYWWGVNADISNDDLYRVSTQRFLSKKLAALQQIDALLTYYSLSYNALKVLRSLAGRWSGEFDHNDLAERFDLNFQALLRLRKRFPDMKIILVPQKDEVGLLGAENADTKTVKAFLARENFAWTACGIGMADYMPIDGHPNGAGYAKLLSCLRAAFKPAQAVR